MSAIKPSSNWFSLPAHLPPKAPASAV